MKTMITIIVSSAGLPVRRPAVGRGCPGAIA
jgi:hypothetical protein